MPRKKKTTKMGDNPRRYKRGGKKEDARTPTGKVTIEWDKHGNVIRPWKEDDDND